MNFFGAVPTPPLRFAPISARNLPSNSFQICPAWGCGTPSWWNTLNPGTNTGTQLPPASNPPSSATGTPAPVRSWGPWNPNWQWNPPAPVNTTGTPSTIQNWDTQGNPIYATPPPGQTVIGYDASGNPLYGTPSSGAAPATSSTSVTVAPATDSYQSILDWLSQSTLIPGMPNWGILAAGFGAYLLLTRQQQGRGRNPRRRRR